MASFTIYKKLSFSAVLFKGSAMLMLFLCTLLLVPSCHKKEEKTKVVARINELEITEQDLITQFNARQPQMDFKTAEQSVKQAVLNDMIDQQLLLLEAYRLGYDKNAELVKLVQEKEQELAAEAFIEKEANAEPVTENLAREYYRLMDKTYDISFIKLNKGQSEQEKQVIIDKANEIYRQLKAGANFNQMAAVHSQHGSAAGDSGRYTLVNCFNLEKSLILRLHRMQTGEISEPLVAGDAVYILKLDRIIAQKLAEFSVSKPEIMEELEKMQQNQKAQKTVKIELALKKQYHYSLFPEQIDFFCNRTKKMKSKSDTLEIFTATEKRVPLSRTDFNEITIGEFLPKVAEYYWDSLSQRRVVEMLLDYMNGKRILKHHAMQQKINELPKIKNQLSVFQVQNLKGYVVQKEVVEKIAVTDEKLLALYERSKADFKVPPSVTVQEIFCRSKEESDRVHALAVAKNDFALLQKTYSQDEETRSNGVLGPFGKGRNGKLGELAFSGMKVGQISEPFRYRGGYSFFKLLAFESERIESFTTVKDKLKAKYLDENKGKFLAEWLKTSRKNYRIELYPLS